MDCLALGSFRAGFGADFCRDRRIGTAEGYHLYKRRSLFDDVKAIRRRREERKMDMSAIAVRIDNARYTFEGLSGAV